MAPEPERYLRAMQRDVEALSALVDDLFLLARIEGGRLDLRREPLDLAELADEAVEALAPAAAARDVTIALGPAAACPVVGNATAIGRVIRNLLDNAIHHAPAGSAVRIAVDDDPGRPRVRVLDDGPGLPARLLPPRLRTLRPGRPEPQPRHRRRRARPGDRPRPRRGPRRPDLDRTTARRAESPSCSPPATA